MSLNLLSLASLLNKRFLLTAAHCVCNTKVPCKDSETGGLEVNYDVGHKLELHFGRTSGVEETFTHSHHNSTDPIIAK